jgi:hypothetical protein
MRTTLTIDDDVMRLIEEEVHRVRKPFKQVVNDALRRGLAPTTSTRQRAPFRVRPHVAKLMPGLDRSRLNALADELEDYAVLAKLGRAGANASRASERRKSK